MSRSRRPAAESRISFAQFSREFVGQFAEPTEELPTVRLVSRATAGGCARRAALRTASASLRRVSRDQLIRHLLDSGALNPVEHLTDGLGTELFSVGPHGGAEFEPIELLLAAEPAGVICYFTALQFFGYTTQYPTSHHVARLTRTPPAVGGASPATPGKPSRDTRSARDRLGSRLFRYQAVPYYRSRRGQHTMIGIQRRHLNDRTIARIVTREQAVLDTLHRPLSCGGASVVWEVWQAALQDLDPGNLAQMAGRLSDSRWRRRAAFMLATLSSGGGAAVERLMRDVQLEMGARSESGSIQLMPGIAGGVIDSDWGLEVPA